MEWGKVVMVALFVLCFSLVNANTGDSISPDVFSSSTIGRNDENPCSFRGQYNNHGHIIQLDSCTRCTCIDSTTNCVIKACSKKPGCNGTELLFVDGECCGKCPNRIYVKETNNLYTGSLHFVQEMRDTININFDLDIAIDIKQSTRLVRGIGMWKLSAWISLNSDGTGDRFSFKDNVFSNTNANQQYFKRHPWIWRNVTYTMQFTGESCNEYNYFCVKFNKGDNPQPKYDLPFTFQAVDNKESRLIGCVPLGNCSGCIESEGWTTFNGHCYKLTEISGNYTTISDLCRSMGQDAVGNTDLAWIESNEENRFISDVIAKQKPSWIGGKRNIDSNFTWIREGHVTGNFDDGYTSWSRGQPDNRLNQEACVVTNRDGTSKWSDIKCHRRLPGICKYRAPFVEYRWNA